MSKNQTYLACLVVALAVGTVTLGVPARGCEVLSDEQLMAVRGALTVSDTECGQATDCKKSNDECKRSSEREPEWQCYHRDMLQKRYCDTSKEGSTCIYDQQVYCYRERWCDIYIDRNTLEEYCTCVEGGQVGCSDWVNRELVWSCTD